MGGLILNTSPTPNGPTTNIFIWTGGTGPWTLGPNWTPGSSPGSPGDIVEVPTGTVIQQQLYHRDADCRANGTLDIVGGSLTVVNGASDGGTIIVEGDPPALTINGPVTVGNIGSFTATGSGDEIQFANGTVDNHGAISAVKQGTVSFVNERITNEPDGKILARGKGSEIEFAGAILTNLGIVVATHHGIVQLSDVMLQNGGLIAADDGGKIWITDLQHGSANTASSKRSTAARSLSSATTIMVVVVAAVTTVQISVTSRPLGVVQSSISKTRMATVSTIRAVARSPRWMAARSFSAAM